MKNMPPEVKVLDDDMLITVAVVTYNHGCGLLNCIDSIANQSYKQIELVVVDDYSCDFDKKTVEDYICSKQSKAIRSVSIEHFSKHCGVAAAYNRALELAKGEYVLFIAGDDYLAGNNVIAEVADELLKSKYDVFQAKGKFFMSNNEYLLPSEECMHLIGSGKLFDLLRVTTYQPFSQLLCIQSAFFSTKWLRDIGGFALNYQYTVDWPVYIRMLYSKVRFAYTDRIVTIMKEGGAYRTYDMGTTHIRKGYLDEAARAIREFAIDNRKDCISEGETILLRSAANAYECRAIVNGEWNFYSLSDKIAWRRENKQYFLDHRACYPQFGEKKASLKRLTVLALAAFVLLIVATMLPLGLSMIKSRMLFIGCVVVCAANILIRQKKTSQSPLDINARTISSNLFVILLFAILAKKVETISVASIAVIVLVCLLLFGVIEVLKRVARMLINRAARSSRGGQL